MVIGVKHKKNISSVPWWGRTPSQQGDILGLAYGHSEWRATGQNKYCPLNSNFMKLTKTDASTIRSPSAPFTRRFWSTTPDLEFEHDIAAVPTGWNTVEATSRIWSSISASDVAERPPKGEITWSAHAGAATNRFIALTDSRSVWISNSVVRYWGLMSGLSKGSLVCSLIVPPKFRSVVYSITIKITTTYAMSG